MATLARREGGRRSMMGLPRRTRSAQGLLPEPKPCPVTLDVASTPIASKSNGSPLHFGDDSPIYNIPSPVPFISTQDGSHGDNDVVWNFYSPKSRRKAAKYIGTPISKKSQIHSLDCSPISSMPVKKKASRNMHNGYLKGLKKELTALNKQVQTLESESKTTTVPSTSNEVEEDCLTVLIDSTNSTRVCPSLKNRISEKISKCESEGIESDDSMNECLLRASQMVEEEIETKKTIPSMKNLRIKNESPSLVNDSFDVIIGNINDSYIETLSQVPVKKQLVNKIDNIVPNELIKKTVDMDKKESIDDSWNNISNISMLLNSSIMNDSKSKFTRHKSMPLTPNTNEKNRKDKSSTSFSRHNSMPHSQPKDSDSDLNRTIVSSCSLEEIRRKHQLARQKLLSKKQENTVIKKISKNDNEIVPKKILCDENEKNQSNIKANSNNIQNEIERKRREALQKLQRKRSQNTIFKK